MSNRKSNPKVAYTNREKSQRRWFYFFIFPWLFGFVTLTLGPMIYSFAMSFTDWDMFTQMNFIGLKNYKDIFQDKRFLISVKNTFVYTFMSVPINMLLSIGMAYLLSFRLKGMKLYRTIYYIPAVVPAEAVVEHGSAIALPNRKLEKLDLKTVNNYDIV